MTLGLTADELAMEQQTNILAKVCVKIALDPDPLLYCTGRGPAKVYGERYEPRRMGLPAEIPWQSPDQQRITIEIDNRDRELSGLHRDGAFKAGPTVTLYKLILWQGQWSEEPVEYSTWRLDRAGGGGQGDHISLLFELSGFVGFSPGIGLCEGALTCGNENQDGVWCNATAACDHTRAGCQSPADFNGLQYAVTTETVISLGTGTWRPGQGLVVRHLYRHTQHPTVTDSGPPTVVVPTVTDSGPTVVDN